MAVNVISWSKALKSGYEPRLYSYTAGDIPTGEIKAMLDVKIWAKKVMGIGCYFTEMGTGRKFLLTVYCLSSGVYKLRGCAVDFSVCPTGVAYRLLIRQEAMTGKISFVVQ